MSTNKIWRYLSLLVFSFSLLSAQTVTIGSLEWQDNAEAKRTKLNWQDAKAYCQDLDLAGHSDWRLPNIKELQSIVDISRYNPAIKKGFSNVSTSDYYLSSSSYVSDDRYAWIVSFKFGYTHVYHKGDVYYVRCVRGRQSL